MEKKNTFQIILIIVFIALIAAGGFYFAKSFFLKKEPANIISTSGRIEGDEFNAASKIYGKVEKIFVQEGQNVKSGEIIAELSSRQSRANLASAEKDILVWKNKLNQANLSFNQTQAITTATIHQAKANLKKARANLAYNEKEYARYKNLFKEDAVPKTKFDAVETQYITAKEEYCLAQKELEKTLAGSYDVEQKQIDIKISAEMTAKAKAASEGAKADLEDSKIYAPADGVVISKIVEQGEVISGGTPVITIINPDNLYLRVFLPTEKAGKIKIGNSAEIIPDAFPNEKFKGCVYKISQKAEFTPKNVETKEQRSKLVFEIKIRIEDNKDRKLKAGMPAEAKIYLDK